MRLNRRTKREAIAAGAMAACLLWSASAVKQIEREARAMEAHARVVETVPVEVIEDWAAPEVDLPAEIEAIKEAVAAAEAPAVRFAITEDERWELASIITAEAVGEPYEGKIAVAQCILQACEDDGIRPGEALVKYSYAKTRPDPCADAWAAVAAVFDDGETVTAEPIKYFYAYKIIYSDFHESQNYILTIGGHKFFKEAKQ